MNMLTPSDFQRESTRLQDVAEALLQGKRLERPDDWYPFYNRDSVDDYVTIKTAIADMADGGQYKPFNKLSSALESGCASEFLEARTMLVRQYADDWIDAMEEQGAWGSDDEPYEKEMQQAWDSDRKADADKHNASLRAGM